jgi:hypothetical protein
VHTAERPALPAVSGAQRWRRASRHGHPNCRSRLFLAAAPTKINNFLNYFGDVDAPTSVHLRCDREITE